MIRIGVLSTLEGPYKAGGEDGLRGVTLALEEFSHAVAGTPVEIVVQSTNAIASSAVEGAGILMHRHHVDLIIGPLSGDEADGIRDVARAHPGQAFVNGAAGSQEIYNPAPNFFSFNPNGVQMAGGLGSYCYHEMGYRRMATLAEGYSFPFAHVAGFVLEFCAAGGEIASILWCPLGTSDFTEYIAQIPDDIDGLFVVLGGSDGLHFVEQYHAQAHTAPLVGGSTYADPTILAHAGAYADLLRGVVCCSPVCDALPDPAWQAFAARYRERFGDEGYRSPSLFALSYYNNTRALLLALTAIGGTLDADHTALMHALRALAWDAPNSHLRLDRHRFPILDNFVSVIDQRDDGSLYTRLLKRIPAIDSTLGYSDEEWLRLGRFGIRNMPCGRWSASYNPLLERLKRQQNSGA